MRVFSFTKVIYDGYLTGDLFVFFVRQKLTRFFSFFALIPVALKFVIRRADSTTMVEEFYRIILNDITVSELELFKTSNIHKVDLEGFGIVKDNPKDIIVTAEPSFLIDLFINRNKFNVICTSYDLRNRKINGKLCINKEKTRRLRMANVNYINQLFVYSFKEKELMDMAEYIFVYRGHEVIEFESYQGTLGDKMFYNIVNRKLLTFVSIAFALSFIMVILASLLSLIINPIVAFLISYLLWLIASYYANYRYITTNKLSISEFTNYLLSFIPNFLLQLLLLVVFKMIIGLPIGIVLFFSNLIAFPLLVFIVRFYSFEE